MCLFVHVTQLQDCREIADGRCWKRPKYARKLINNIGFLIGVNTLSAKLRYRRRLWRRVSRRGWGMPMPGMAERGQVWAADGRFCHGRRVTGVGGRGRFRMATFVGEEDDQEMAFITLVIITVLPGTATKRHSPCCRKGHLWLRCISSH